MSTLSRMIPVYCEGDNRRAPANDYINPEGAEALVTSGVARWSSPKQTVVVVKRTRGEIKLRDLSCQMGPGVTQAVIEGSRYHEAMLQGWAPVITNGRLLSGGTQMTEGHVR